MPKNFIKFNDVVSFSLTDKNLVRIKDDYSGIGPSVARASGGTQQTPAGLLVSFAATHAGIVTKNNGFYVPDRMKKGASSFLKDYAKPILVHHKEHSDPIGRAVDAKYIDTSGLVIDHFKLSEGLPVRGKDNKEVGTINDVLIHDFVDGSMPFGMMVDTIVTLLRDGLIENDEYIGLGFLQLIANIADRDAINKLLDGRYLTGSVGVTTNRAICSICRQDWVETGPCEHQPGAIYDGSNSFLIFGDLEYDEYSLVNRPADKYSRAIELNCNGIRDSIEIANDYLGRICEVRLGFPQYDSADQEDVMPEEKDPVVKPIVEIQDEVIVPEIESPQETTQDEVLGKESFDDFITRIIKGEDFKEDDASKAYELMAHEMGLEDALPKSEEDWEQITQQMEKFAAELDGEDEDLEIEDTETDAKKKPQDKPGGSNVGKHKTGPFCGPSGGAPKGSYPVNTSKRAKAALAYARHAPNPAGIRKCVCRHFPSLPSCKKKDYVLDEQTLAKLPTSSFCGSNRTFPAVDQYHYLAIVSLLDRYTGEADTSEIRKVADRKAKVKDWVLEIPEQQDESQHTDKIEHARILRALLNALEEDKFYSNNPVLDDDEIKLLQNVIKRMAALVSQDTFTKAIVAEGLAIDPVCEQVLSDEVTGYEEKVVELKDTVAALRKEHAALFQDMEALQDELVKTETKVRTANEKHLFLLVSLRDTKIEDQDLTQISNEDLVQRITEAQAAVDMTKIIDKLGDGMTRNPTETVDDPSTVYDNKDVTIKDQVTIQEKYYELLFGQGKIVADAFIKHMQKEGKLPLVSE